MGLFTNKQKNLTDEELLSIPADRIPAEEGHLYALECATRADTSSDNKLKIMFLFKAVLHSNNDIESPVVLLESPGESPKVSGGMTYLLSALVKANDDSTGSIVIKELISSLPDIEDSAQLLHEVNLMPDNLEYILEELKENIDAKEAISLIQPISDAAKDQVERFSQKLMALDLKPQSTLGLCEK